MNNPIRGRGIAATTLAALVSTLLGEPRTVAQVATFENFSQGFVGSWFVDPASGILFTNAVYNLPNGVFSIDYSTNPPALPGNHLTGNVYSDTPSLGLTSGFGFTFILPTPSTRLQMDEIYLSDPFNSFSIAVVAYASNGQQVLQTNVSLPNTWPQIGVAHSVFVSATPMSRVVVTTPSNRQVGFDNIGSPPLIQTMVVSNHTAILTTKYTTPQSLLLSSTNLTTWSTTLAEVTNDSGWAVFTVPLAEPRMFFRVQQ